MSSLRVLVISTIAVLMVHEGETIKCWACHSHGLGGAGCGDPFLGSADDDDAFFMECGKDTLYLQFLPNGTTRTSTVNPGLKMFCHKLTGKSLGAKVVMRGCALGLPDITRGSCMDAEPQNATGGNILTCDVCSGDLCNGAARLEAVAVLLAPLLVLLALISNLLIH